MFFQYTTAIHGSETNSHLAGSCYTSLASTELVFFLPSNWYVFFLLVHAWIPPPLSYCTIMVNYQEMVGNTDLLLYQLASTVLFIFIRY